jgi:hypothetical protein
LRQIIKQADAGSFRSFISTIRPRIFHAPRHTIAAILARQFVCTSRQWRLRRGTPADQAAKRLAPVLAGCPLGGLRGFDLDHPADAALRETRAGHYSS